MAIKDDDTNLIEHVLKGISSIYASPEVKYRFLLFYKPGHAFLDVHCHVEMIHAGKNDRN